MHVFSLLDEQEFNPKRHVEKVLEQFGEGDVTIACWEPGQISPYHAHPNCTEIYFCFQGSGTMKTPEETVDVTPGGITVHPPGEMHEYANGPGRSLLFRVRYGKNMEGIVKEWPSYPDWKPGDKPSDWKPGDKT